MQEFVARKHTRVNGLDLHYLDGGSGDPIVLLHGFTGVADDFRLLFDLDALAQARRVIAVDLRGHGRTPNPSKSFSHRECASDVVRLLETLRIETFDAVGISLGANTLLHVAPRLGPRHLVLVSATPRYAAATRLAMRRMGEAGPSESEWPLLRSRHPRGDEAIVEMYGYALAMAESRNDMDLSPASLAAIDSRVFLVAGDRDPLYPLEFPTELYRGLKNASLWIIPDEGHAPIFGAWRSVFASRALSFLHAPQEAVAL